MLGGIGSYFHYSSHQISKSAFSPSVVPSSTKECVGISKFTGITSNEKMEMLMCQISGLYITIKPHVGIPLWSSVQTFLTMQVFITWLTYFEVGKLITSLSHYVMAIASDCWPHPLQHSATLTVGMSETLSILRNCEIFSSNWTSKDRWSWSTLVYVFL